MATPLPQNALFLVDGSYLLYRSYFGLPALTGPNGKTVHATYSFCRTLNKLLKEYAPQHIAIVWDSPGGSTSRKELAPTYKANRQTPPNDLFEQKKDIIRFIETIGMRNVMQAGYEADDLIGTIVHEQPETPIVIITADKDLCQLLNQHVVIFDPFKNKLIDQTIFMQDYGFPSEKVSFYHALLGDTSDNIPGVKGVGEKSAEELVTQFASLDDLYQHLDQVKKERIKKLLTEQEASARLSLLLFTLDPVPLNLPLSTFSFQEKTWANAIEFFKEFDFKSLIKELEARFGSQPVTTTEAATLIMPKTWTMHLVGTIEELNNMIKHLGKSTFIGVDTETTGVLPLIDDLVGLSFAYNETDAYYIPVTHKNLEQQPQLSKAEVLDALKPILISTIIKKTLHNAKFDELVLFNQGITMNAVSFDTLIAASLVRIDDRPINLKSLSLTFLKEPMIKFKDVMSKKYNDFSDVPITEGAEYGAHDALQALKLAKIFQAKLAAEPTLEKLFNEIEMPLSRVLLKIEKTGIKLNVEKIQATEKKVTDALHILEGKIFAAIDEIDGPQEERLNLASPKQVEDLLFMRLKLPVGRKNKSGSRSTDHEVLEELSKIHPIPTMIMKHRELTKLLSTYIQPLPQEVNPKTGRIHTTFSQTNVITGRLSSSNPNLQNIPASGEFGLQIRDAFEATPGCLLLSADYAQIELRVLANLSEDQNLHDIFLAGKDIHIQTAAQLFAIPINSVTNEQRQIGKRINFSIIYGMTPYSLAKEFDISPSEAKLYIDRYFAQYPQVAEWMNKTVELAKEKGYVESLWGRRRYLPELHEKNKNRYEAATRAAINTPIQATQADIIKIAMINLDKLFVQQKLESKLILQIHDELLFEVPEHEILTVQSLVQKTMEQVINWKIPLKVTMRLGKNWGEVTK